jgi:hypothetical protein
MNMLPASNDHVLDSARDEYFTLGHIRAIAAVDPARMDEARRRLGIIEVSVRCRRPLELETALLPLAELAPIRIDDTDLIAVQGQAAAHEAERVRILRGGWPRVSSAREGVAGNSINEGAARQRREGKAKGTFRKPVDRRQSFAMESVGCKAGMKAIERLRQHGFGSTEGHAPRTQVQASDIWVSDAPDT